MNELLNDGIKLLKLEIKTSFINRLPKKWLSFYQSFRNINHVKESELASLFCKLKYEENLIDSIYESEKKKFVVTATRLSSAFFSTSIVQDFQDSPDDEEDTRSNEEDMSSNDNEMTEVKVLMTLVDDESFVVGKESARNGEWVKISMKNVHTLLDMEDNDERKSFLDYLSDDTKVSIPGVERPWLSKAEGFTLPNHDTADESSVCSTPIFLLEKLAGAELVYGPKTIKSIWKSNSTFKVETLKGVTINEPYSALAKGKKMVQLQRIIQLLLFDEKRGTIFNSNKEIVMIAPRVRDVYVLNMTYFAQESFFFAKATENLNWLWHKRLAHLNFKTINQLEKQNLVIGLPSLVYSKDKPCSSCEKGKHHRASFKTK
ncbi:retrovirus-related pol polyprotein from transposon TNT 1-94 [Tanacetum coccineum]